jgi:hypothetical protein
MLLYCVGELYINTDGTPVCDQWQTRTEQQVAEASGMRLTAEDFSVMKDSVLLLFVAAYGIRAIRHLFEARVARE